MLRQASNVCKPNARRAIKSFDQTFSKVWPPAGPPEATGQSRCDTALEGDKPFTYGAVGRYYVEKNQHDDIKGWKLILEPLALELSPQKAKYLQVDKAAKIPYEAMPDFYMECHCYICSSKSEGNPLPLLEAASCGLPLLSTEVGIAPEIIQEGGNGMILPRKKHAFAKAIKDLSNRKTRCNEMGKHSRKIILSNRDWWFVTKKWAEFYQSVL